METTIINPIIAPAKVASKVITKGATLNKAEKVAKVIQPGGTYKRDVLFSHFVYKQECKTLGGVRSLMLTVPSAIPPLHMKVLKRSSNSQALYEAIKADIRTTKTGGYTVFYLRQCINKNLSKYLEFC